MSLKPPETDNWLNSKLLDKIVKTVQKNILPDKYKKEFRVSSLPYCPLLDLVEEKEDKVKELDYDMNFYVDIGTAVHSVFQKFAKNSKNVKLIGDWKCNAVLSTKYDSDPPSSSITRCEKKYSFCSLKKAIKQHECPHNLKVCKDNLEYSEMELKYNGLTGHVDLLFLIKDKYYLVDIKTTSNYLFDNTKSAIEKGYYPNKKYWEQITTYATMLEKQYNITIFQYAILYVSRERTSSKRKGHMLFVRPFTEKERQGRNKKLEQQISNNSLAKKYKKKPSKRLLDKIWENRPCQKSGDYENQMAYKYFDKVCVFHKDKTCQSKKVLQTIESLYDKK